MKAEKEVQRIRDMQNDLYEMIAYYSEKDQPNGIIYNGEYTYAQVEQATRASNAARKALNLLGQVLEGREFDWGYFESFESAVKM